MKFPPGYVPGSGVHKASGFGGFGERLLRQQGWEKGEGLGKHKSGRAEAIQVKKKEDTAGVGANRSQVNSTKWWEGAFDTAVNDIARADSDSDSDSDVSTADEVTVQIRSKQDDASNAVQHELQIAADLAWFGGGRFGGREGKMARIRQQEALAAAALGTSSINAEISPVVSPVKALKKHKRDPIPAEHKSAEPVAAAAVCAVKHHKSSKKGKVQPEQSQQQPAAASAVSDAAAVAPSPAQKRKVIEPAYESTAPVVPFVATPATGWWGAKKFKSAGCLEGLHQQQSKAQSDRQEFDEDDQAKLYMAAQNLKTSGKKGLGTKSHTGKVAGARWQGSRTTFDNADAQQEHDQGQQTDLTIGSTSAADADKPSGSGLDANPLQQLPKIKWKKLATAQLQKTESKRLKLKTLQRLLVEETLAKHHLSQHHEQILRSSLLKALSGSSQFQMTDKSIALS